MVRGGYSQKRGRRLSAGADPERARLVSYEPPFSEHRELQQSPESRSLAQPVHQMNFEILLCDELTATFDPTMRFKRSNSNLENFHDFFGVAADTILPQLFSHTHSIACTLTVNVASHIGSRIYLCNSAVKDLANVSPGCQQQRKSSNPKTS